MKIARIIKSLFGACELHVRLSDVEYARLCKFLMRLLCLCSKGHLRGSYRIKGPSTRMGKCCARSQTSKYDVRVVVISSCLWLRAQHTNICIFVIYIYIYMNIINICIYIYICRRLVDEHNREIMACRAAPRMRACISAAR